MIFKLTALTPLLVGDGRELAPIDYMVWKDQVNVLDQTRIFKLLARGPRLDGYLAQLRKATKLDFASWGGFAQNFSQRRIPFEDTGLTAIWNAAPSESLFIQTFAANLNGPYLPASALKGALRTGLVFARWSPATIERAASSMEGDRVHRRIAEAAETNAGASQMKIVSMADGHSGPDSVFKIYVSRVASLDTRTAAKPQLAWKVAGRGNVPPQRVSDATPTFVEMAVPGTTFSGSWEERSFFESQDLARFLGWRSAPEPRIMIDAANQYAAAQLTLHSHFAAASGLSTLQNGIKQLQDELESARNSSLTCLLSLGWGGGFISKSAFLDTELQAFRKMLRSVPAISKGIRENVPFPKTRRVIFTGGQPSALPGWVRLELNG